MGLLLLRCGQFAKAEQYFRTTIKSITSRNPNPYDGEPYYNLGISLQLQGRFKNAYEAFYKATWSDAWQHSSFLQLARIDAIHHNYDEALILVEKSLAEELPQSFCQAFKVNYPQKIKKNYSRIRLYHRFIGD
jgi:tetratricopeptide (TPR) repeat protein